MNHLMIFLQTDCHDQHSEIPLTVWVPRGVDPDEIAARVQKALNDNDDCECWCGPLTYELQSRFPIFS